MTVLQGVLIGSLANRSASDGIDVFPNLGYKKDAFLELSLVATTSHFFTQQTDIQHSYHQLYHFILNSTMSSNNLQQQQPQQSSGPAGLNPGSGTFVPRGPLGPLPVDSVGRSTVAMLHGVCSRVARAIKLC